MLFTPEMELADAAEMEPAQRPPHVLSRTFRQPAATIVGCVLVVCSVAVIAGDQGNLGRVGLAVSRLEERRGGSVWAALGTVDAATVKRTARDTKLTAEGEAPPAAAEEAPPAAAATVAAAPVEGAPPFPLWRRGENPAAAQLTASELVRCPHPSCPEFETCRA